MHEQESEKETLKKGTSVLTARLANLSQAYKSDSFTILDAHMDGNLMHLTVEYSGGCEVHSFEVLGSNAIMKSMPPQRAVLILHNANGDACRSLIVEQLTVDLSEFAYQQEDGSEIFLVVEGLEKIPFVFERNSK